MITEHDLYVAAAEAKARRDYERLLPSIKSWHGNMKETVFDNQIAVYEQGMLAVWDKKYPYKAEAFGVRPENIPGNHASIVIRHISTPGLRKFWFQTWTERDVFCKQHDGTPC